MSATTSTIQSTSYAPQAQPLQNEVLDRAATLASLPYQQYLGQQVAGPDQLQLQAQQGAANLRTSQGLEQAQQLTGMAALNALNTQYGPMNYAAQQAYAPNLQNYQMTGPANVGAQALQNYQMAGPANISTGQFTDPNVAASYMSPYQQQVIDNQKLQAQRQSDIAQAAIMGETTQRGAYGGGRQAIMQAEQNRNNAFNLQQIQAAGNQTAYEQAMAQYNADQARRLGASQANQNVGLQVGQQNLAANLATQQLGSAQSLAAQQANQATGLATGQQNLQAMLGVQQLGAGQSLAAQQANQQAALAAQQANEQSRQYGAGLTQQANTQALSAANQLGALGQAEFGQQKDVITGQAAAGAERQALQQQQLSTDYNNFLQQQQYPYQQAAWMNEMIKSAPTQTTQAIYAPPPSIAGQLAGVGAMALSGSKAGFWANGGIAGLSLYNLSRER